MSGDHHKKLDKLISYIEENLRAKQSSGIKFVDPRNLKQKLLRKQNYVIFGRRGSGKTSLVKSIESSDSNIPIYLNLEVFKDITFPNIILQILCESFKSFKKVMKKTFPVYKMRCKPLKFRKKLKKEIKKIKKYIHSPDKGEREQRTITHQEGKAGADFKGILKGMLKKSKQTEVAQTIPVDKLNKLRLNLPSYKEIFNELSSLNKNKSVFLIFDDLYFISKEIQPKLIDYFHLISKETPTFLKIATIKYRSKLYQREQGSFIGVELGNDALEIDMDYTLDKFEELQNFMKQLLQTANNESRARLKPIELFSKDGFIQLCLASGGVPRDFLALFAKLVEDLKISKKTRTKIGKVEVNKKAIASIKSKLDTFNIVSEKESEILDTYLNMFKRKIYSENRTNAFLIAKQDFEECSQAKQAIKELVDLRLIHLLNNNTSSAPSDGRSYEAYILDVGLYENPRPRNFDQIHPGLKEKKSRKDKIRAAPKISLHDLEAEVNKKGLPGQLEISE